jgi:hypothetical protein
MGEGLLSFLSLPITNSIPHIFISITLFSLFNPFSGDESLRVSTQHMLPWKAEILLMQNPGPDSNCGSPMYYMRTLQ